MSVDIDLACETIVYFEHRPLDAKKHLSAPMQLFRRKRDGASVPLCRCTLQEQIRGRERIYLHLDPASTNRGVEEPIGEMSGCQPSQTPAQITHHAPLNHNMRFMTMKFS